MHIHTSVSDGRLSPEEILREAKQAGLSYIAITDHDTVKALHKLQALHLYPSEEIEIIPGIEFSAHRIENEVHILGYHIDIFHEELQANLDKVVECRWKRFSKIICKLRALGYAITEEDVLAVAGKTESIGRAHIAQALVNRGFFSRLGEVFDEVLRKNGSAYVPHFRLTSTEIIRLIKKAGGIAVLAHPGLIGDERVVEQIIQEGIDGIEVFHPRHSIEKIDKYKKIAKAHNLIITGGSDYHAIPTRYPKRLGEFTVEDSYVTLLNDRVNNR